MKLGVPQVLAAGPWKSVFSSTDPYDDNPAQLQAAVNCYIPDSANGSGVYQRPALIKSGQTVAGTRAANGWTITMRDGTIYNFIATFGKLYRISGDLSTATDVTPGGVTIDNGLTTRVFFQSYNDTLIVSDGVNRPWYGTNLGATPITGTYIHATTAAGAWTAFGQPTQFAGVLVFMVKSPASGQAAKARISIIWCEPGDQTIGYEQTGYTNFANLIQTSSKLLTAIFGTNFGLYYWRDSEIGVVSGIVDGSFNSTATAAAVSSSIGCAASATIRRYGDMIYFCDQFGRPQSLPIGGKITEPQIWLQARQVVDAQTAAAGYATALLNVAVGEIEPNLNLYLCAPYASGSLGVNNFPPTFMFVFDAKTGSYLGTWTVSNGCEITGLCQLTDTNGAATLCAIAYTSPGNTPSLIWSLTRLSANSWSDSTTAQTVSVTTNRLGYSDTVVWDAGNTADAVVMSAAANTLALQTPQTASTSMGSATPVTSADGTYRSVWGVDIHAAREITATVTPTLGAAQWGLQRFSITATPSLALPDDA